MAAPEPTKWIGAAPVPRKLPDTLDLPAEEPVYEPRVAYRPPAPPRRRRKWPWVFAFFALCCLGVCGGCVAYVKPFYDQYPATAATGATVTGLTVVHESASTGTARRLSERIGTGQLDESRFSVVYAEAGNSRKRATVFGGTRFVVDPPKDLGTSFDKLRGELALNGVQDVDPGPLGGVQRCGTGRLDGRTVAVCAWADHGSLGVGLFTGRSVADSAPLLQAIRAAIIRR
jgi:hypothetical protein